MSTPHRKVLLTRSPVKLHGFCVQRLKRKLYVGEMFALVSSGEIFQVPPCSLVFQPIGWPSGPPLLAFMPCFLLLEHWAESLEGRQGGHVRKKGHEDYRHAWEPEASYRIKFQKPEGNWARGVNVKELKEKK